MNSVAAGSPPTAVAVGPLQSERRVRSDVRFLRIYVRFVKYELEHRDHPEALDADDAPVEVVGRIETGLAGVARLYRAVGWSILALLLALPLLSGFLWSGMYWLPVRIYWWPFERGNYGLPFLSLFEWLCYLILAAYFALTWGLLRTVRDETSRLATEYRRLLDPSPDYRIRIANVLAAEGHPRAEFVFTHAAPFSAYAELLSGRERP